MKVVETIKFLIQIYIYGWKKNDPSVKRVILIENDDSNSISKKYIINDIINSYQFKDVEDDGLLLKIQNKFKTNKNYKLILNDSLEYMITNFYTENIERGTAVTTKIYCELKSYQVNGKKIEYVGNHFYFSKDLGLPLK